MKNKGLASLQSELDRIYHNATLEGKLRLDSDYESDLYESSLELQKEDFFSDYKQGLIEELVPFQKVFPGKLYQWGRGGRTVASTDLIAQRGGSIFRIIKAEDLMEELFGVHNWTDQDCETIADRIRELNNYIKSWCQYVPDSIIEENREEYKEEIELNKGKTRKTRTVVSYE